jgi:hypothetical protein
MFKMVKPFKLVKVGEVFQFNTTRGDQLFRKTEQRQHVNAFYLDSKETCTFADTHIVRTKV